MEIRTAQRPLCPLCAGRGEVLYPELEDSWYNVPGKWCMKRCPDPACGLCWLDPVAIEADLPRLYADYFTHEVNLAALTFKSRLRSFLINIYESVKLLPLALLGLAAEKRQFSTMFLSDLPSGRVLDVGCGGGKFLFRMHQAGWSVVGIDFDAKGIEGAKAKYAKYGFELKHSDIFSCQFAANSFDAVTMSHVIEHVMEPAAVVKEIRRILKPGGRFVAVTPNVGSYGQKLFRDCWRDWDPPRHLQLFSLPALASCARQAGFAEINVKSSAARADLVFGGSLAIRQARASGSKSRGSNDINISRAIRSCFMQYREAIRWRSQPDCGEEAVLICHK
jgi:2-polyprenyl-3-methyl-5-hydroxy-6-metoxy-1,4-benzoquinol methylase